MHGAAKHAGAGSPRGGGEGARSGLAGAQRGDRGPRGLGAGAVVVVVQGGFVWQRAWGCARPHGPAGWAQAEPGLRFPAPKMSVTGHVTRAARCMAGDGVSGHVVRHVVGHHVVPLLTALAVCAKRCCW